MSGKVFWLSLALFITAGLALVWTREWFTDAELASIPGPTPAASAGPLPAGPQQATLGGGCFWCTEAVFQRLKGVAKVVSGYSGGSVKNPTYKQVCSGSTGHAEVIQISYDPAVLSFAELLEVFWKTHDPTTLNRQGNDRGTQYRSVIFYHSEQQKGIAEKYKRQLDESAAFKSPLVTEIAPFTAFYPAEKDHQNYYLDNSRQPYCTLIIRPKIEKFEKAFKTKLKPATP